MSIELASRTATDNRWATRHLRCSCRLRSWGAGWPSGREGRRRSLHRLDEAAARRAVAWVSAEGVGVAPAIPTLGDRRASGHTIIGLAVFDRSALRAEAIGRCWSQGRLLAWLADS